MTLSISANLSTALGNAYKTPVFLIHFDGETTDYANHSPASPDNTVKKYLHTISGLSQQVTPEEGKASVSGLSFSLLDVDNEITALLATDSYYFHRKKTTVKFGLLGIAEADMATICTGWVTGLKLSSDGLLYEFDVTDPRKWLSRKIWRGSEDSTVTAQGNPINVLLSVLTSTGAGTNGSYDAYAEANGLGIDDDYIDVTGIEALRDEWFPGDSHWMRWQITERMKAADWIQKEILKPLNLYPMTDGQGRYTLKILKPSLPGGATQTLTEADNIIGLPSWDANLSALINEVEFSYNWNSGTEDFDNIDFYADATSITNRGPGNDVLEIKSKGLVSSAVGSRPGRAAEIIARRQASVFQRWATPPIKITVKAWLDRCRIEAGDVVPVTHSLLPDIEAGVRGLTARKMEAVKRDIDWRRGIVTVTLLDTGFAQSTYASVSPTMTVASGTSATEFEVSSADAAKFSSLTAPVVSIFTSQMRLKVADKAISSISGTTVTIADLGFTPAAGDIVAFAGYDSVTAEQARWGYIADASDNLGAGDDDAHLIIP